MERRNFIKTLTAVPYMITSAALGNALTPPASDRITLGFIGTGGRGEGLIKGFLPLKDCQCVATCDPFKDRREARGKLIDDFYMANAARGSHKSCATYNDFR